MKSVIIHGLFFLFIVSCIPVTDDSLPFPEEKIEYNLNPEPNPLRDKKVEILWYVPIFDSVYKDSTVELVLNEDEIYSLSNPERAAIGYISTFYGTECDWDGKANDEWTNLKCKLTNKLGLGYQCSDQHLNFLKSWFKDEDSVLLKLEECPLVPYTATSQNAIKKLSLEVTNDTIIIQSDITGANLRELTFWSYSKIDSFKVHLRDLSIISESTSEVTYNYVDPE